MPEIIIACSATENYLEQIKPYLVSLNTYSIAKNVLVCVGFEPPQEYFADLPRVEWVTITHEQNEGAPEGTNSIQHGSFIDLVSDDDDDTIIYTDGDMIIQRPFTMAEQGYLRDMWQGEVGVSYNSGPSEMLIHEAMRLQPRGTELEVIKRWGDLIETEPCFNIGVLVARKKTWRAIHKYYMEMWKTASDYFQHRARQQWLVCYTMACLHLNRRIRPYSFHTHSHYGLPANFYLTNGVACHEDRIVMFRHHF